MDECSDEWSARLDRRGRPVTTPDGTSRGRALLQSVVVLLVLAALAVLWSGLPAFVDGIYHYQPGGGLAELIPFPKP